MMKLRQEIFQNESKERIVFLVDMNSYFATCEQMSNPFLRGKPIGVAGSNLKRTVITAASCEAKRHGVQNGMNVVEAKQRCPQMIVVVGDPDKYADTTTKFLKIFQDYSPELEIFSIDEAFLDVTETQSRFGGPVALAKEIKRRLKEEIGSLFTCSVGISYNKVMAKLAASKMKPDGLVMIARRVTDDDRQEFKRKLGGTPGKIVSTQEILGESRLTDLCGIGKRIERRLLNMGIDSIQTLAQFPKERLQKAFGVYGIFLHLISRGEDPSPVIAYWKEPPFRSMSRHYTIPEDVHSREELEPLIRKLAENLGIRLRADAYRGKTVHFTLSDSKTYSYSQQKTLSFYIEDGFEIYQAACRILDGWPFPPSVRFLGIGITQLVKNHHQLSLIPERMKQENLLDAIDEINYKFGESSIQPARIMDFKLKVHTSGYVEDRAKAFKQFGVKIKK